VGLRHDDLIWLAGMCAEGMALGSTFFAAREEPRHRAVARLFAFAFASDLAAKALQVAFLAGAPRPFAGVARGAYHMEVAISVAWPCLLAYTAARLFLRERVHAACVPVGAWLGVVVSHVAHFPMKRAGMARVFLAVELAMLLWAGACVAVGWRSAWRSVHGVLLFLLGTELVVVLLGPYASDVFRDWNVARVIYMAAFVGLAFWYAARPVRPHLAS